MDFMERKRPPSRDAVAAAVTLSRNIHALRRHYGIGGIKAWASRLGIGEATLTRMKDASPGTQLDSIVALARGLDLEVWQLLVPDLDPAAPPKLRENRYSPLVERIAAALEENEVQRVSVAALLGVQGVDDAEVERRMPITQTLKEKSKK